jgi:hypothetical protein
VTNRLTGAFLTLALAALLAACSASNLVFSNIALAYSNATPMLTWAVDDFIDLSDVQKDWVRGRITRVMAWHRSRELPEYRRFLTGIEASLAGGLTVDEVRAAHVEMRGHYHRLVAQVLPDAADLLLQLDAEQVEGLERKFAEDNRTFAKEGGRNSEERRKRSTRRTIEHLEAWTGPLDDAQRDLVASRLATMPDLFAERMADRRARQARTLALIRSKPDRDTMIAELRRLLIDTDTWRNADYLRKLQARDERNFEMIATLSTTLSTEQRAHLHKRLSGFVSDINTLTAGAVKPAS